METAGRGGSSNRQGVRARLARSLAKLSESIGPTRRSFQKLESFVVAAALEKMGKPWRDRPGKRFGQLLDAIGDFAQAFDVLFWLTATFFVCNNFASLAQGRGELAFGACHEQERKL